MNKLQKQFRSGVTIGDIVRLNSGSPDLRVTAINETDITVEWDSANGVCSDTFPAPCLREGWDD